MFQRQSTIAPEHIGYNLKIQSGVQEYEYAVEFTSRECVLGGRSYPLGFFVAEALDKIPNIVEFRSSVAHMKEEQRGISDRQRRIQRGDGI